jgi:DNA-binding CsgD family transcriptional regulator
MEVPPLSPEATLALAQNELGGEVLPSVAESLHQRTRGHPLFATETLRRWRDTNRIAPIANRWAFSGDGSNDSSGTLDDLLRYRARGVSSEARSVLHLLSVVSRVTGFEELKALARLQHEHLVEAITELAEMGLITVRAGAEAGYALAHPLLEAAVRNSLGSVRTGDLHERVFRVLSSRREAGSAVPASELAHHAVAALEAPGDLPELVSAAALEASSAGSHLEEATWFGKLAEIVKDPNRKREAIQNQARAAINFDPRWAIDLFTQSLQHELPEVERAHALLGRAQAWRITGCLEEALNDLTHALPMASSDDMFDIQHSRAYLTALTGDIEAGERILVDLAQGEVRESTPFKILGHLGSFAFARSDLLAARRLWEMALRSCGERGYRAFLLHNLGWACMLLGEWNIAQALADEAIRMARESGDAWNLVAILAADARLESWRGDTARALDLAWESARLAPKLENPGCRIDAFDALGVVLLEDGLPVEAASFLRDATSLITVAPEQREFAFTFAMLGEALALTNRLPEASKAIQEAREHLPSAEFWQVTVDRADALVEFTLGNYPRALDLLCPWVETEPGILRFEVARCNQLAARVHAACESRERALAFAQEALKSFEEIGAMKRARETETWIRDHRGRKRGRPRGPSSALTRREHQVLDLVSLGRTNKEIARALSLSVGTVKKHVENMMAKTHSTTRTELAHRVTAQPDSAITRP